MIDLRLDVPIRVAVVCLSDLHVIETAGATEEPARWVAREMASCAAAYRAAAEAKGTSAPGGVPGVETARSLFRALGIDPTRRRPSSEALLNRALKDRPMPAVNTLVDVGNWCSLDFLLPLGAYDRDRLEGGIVLRQGIDDEGYDGIAGKRVNLAGRYALVDDRGPFGSPITDSLRTAVTSATRRALVVLYGPDTCDVGSLRERGDQLCERAIRCCGGHGSVAIVEGPPVTDGPA